ncbi:hypothetical protein CONPUDRAFT_156841 [Coniophora puteana RWD-64-598 SS2]|uniref:Uncharacterized protein n=1 Tax=Coniophora puteana (strain RWD-64-598) TaxID=741705 RepID=A0A5M3MGB3_CONPW|nr:uncharacterized protein CONPUDRAFT_156841 [Coniophora puteana RWD-64-598 SS2]EIW77641.1 hypothetical protein CONPUDRAFT_156841 [Coniophora puteana RWD-64-598 SS2]
MSSRVTRASNADKHPGDLHRALNRRTAEEVELQKKQKKAEQEKKNAEMNRSHERVASLENELAKKRAKKVAHAPTAPPFPTTGQKGKPRAAAAAAVANNDNDNDATPKVPSRPKLKTTKSSAANSSKGKGNTEGPAKAAKPKPTQTKAVSPADGQADESDGAGESVDNNNEPAPKPVARKRGGKGIATKKTNTGGDDGTEANNMVEAKEVVKAVKKSLAESATYRAQVDKKRKEVQPVSGAEISAAAAKGKST